MDFPWPIVVVVCAVLASVLGVLVLMLYKSKTRQPVRLGSLKTVTVNTSFEKRPSSAADPEHGQTKEQSSLGAEDGAASDAKPPVSVAGSSRFVRPCYAVRTTPSSASMPDERRRRSDVVDELRIAHFPDRRPSATELTEAELMGLGQLPRDFVSELEERERQQRRKGSFVV